jgi:4'-phosphopantetheinyl transferase
VALLQQERIWETAGAGPWPRLEPGEVHIFRCRASAGAARVESLLSPSETLCASRFHFREDRNMYVAAHGLARLVLSRHLGLRPESLFFVTGEKGKPALAPGGVPVDLRFNLAHSGCVVLMALAEGREVGIDVERIRQDFPVDGIALRFFSPAESSAIGAYPRESRAKVFFSCWTRKEAVLKARGTGLVDLDSFDVPVSEAPVTELAIPPALGDMRPWTLFDLPAGPGFAAAVVVEGRAATLRCFDFDHPQDLPTEQQS